MSLKVFYMIFVTLNDFIDFERTAAHKNDVRLIYWATHISCNRKERWAL